MRRHHAIVGIEDQRSADESFDVGCGCAGGINELSSGHGAAIQDGVERCAGERRGYAYLPNVPDQRVTKRLRHQAPPKGSSLFGFGACTFKMVDIRLRSRVKDYGSPTCASVSWPGKAVWR
jgi:hypothetical protein